VDELEIVFEPFPADAVSRHISDGVDLYNIAMTGMAEWYPANFFLRSPRGEWLGGVLANIWGEWLHVRMLWVAAGERGQGRGRALLRAAETYARDKGCRGSTLETFSFQARPFYEREGYEVVGVLDDYPPGHQKFFLRKNLA
jgi:GNAT superfamily N-acetyltransferase